MLLSSTRKDWLGNVRGDVLAGIVVALALIPEAIAFSIIAGVDPGGPLLGVLYSSRYGLLWRTSGDDFVLHRCNGSPDGDAGERSWLTVFTGCLHTDRGIPADSRISEAWRADAFCFTLSGHGVC